MRDNVPWTELIGFQYEFLHTGVLQWLLEQDTPSALDVARALTGGGDITSVDWTGTQTHAGGRRASRPDLTACVVVGGARRIVAVETTVDSEATRGQLEQMSGPGSTVVLLALGMTAFGLHEFDSLGEDREFTVIDLDAWEVLLDSLGDVPSAVDVYRRDIHREREEHHQARAAVRQGLSLDGTTRHDALLSWAWLDEVARGTKCMLDEPHSHLHAHRKASGPILFWEGSWRGLGGRSGSGVFIDLMVDGGRRRAVAKGTKLTGDRREWALNQRRRLGKHVCPPARKSRDSSDTFTIGRLDLDDVPLVDAVQRVDELYRALDRLAAEERS